MGWDPEAAGTSAVTTAGDIMSSPVITVRVDAERAVIAEVLTRRKISAAVVVDDGDTVVGLVSEYDLLAKSSATAGELMSTAIISVSPDCPVGDLRHLLIERRIRRVPVLRDGRLVGIVSRGDVVATMALEWVCHVCGEPARGEQPPTVCPKCHADGNRFSLQEQSPGA